MVDWISGAEAAGILGVSPRTVLRSLENPDRRQEKWGDQGVGWRYKPLTVRPIFQVSRERAEQLAAGGDQTDAGE